MMRSEGCKEAEFGVEGKELAKPKRQRRTKEQQWIKAQCIEKLGAFVDGQTVQVRAKDAGTVGAVKDESRETCRVSTIFSA